MPKRPADRRDAAGSVAPAARPRTTPPVPAAVEEEEEEEPRRAVVPPGGTTPAEEEYPVVPFPRLHMPTNPEEEEGQSRPAKSPPPSASSPTMMMLLLLLFLANGTLLACVAARRTWSSIVRIGGESELYALRNALAASQNEVNVLRSRMEVLERMSSRGGGRTPADDDDDDDGGEFAGLFGPTRVVAGDDDDEDRSTVDGRKAWFEKMRLLEEDRDSALGRIQKSLSEF